VALRPSPDCPSCRVPMMFWSGYRRYVREAGLSRKVRYGRAREGPGRPGLLSGRGRGNDGPLLAGALNRCRKGRQASDIGVVLDVHVGRGREVAVNHVDGAVGTDRCDDADVVGKVVEVAGTEEQDAVTDLRRSRVELRILALADRSAGTISLEDRPLTLQAVHAHAVRGTAARLRTGTA
jgi:hypothetical protein